MITKRMNEAVATGSRDQTLIVVVALGGLFAIQPARGQDSGNVTVDVEHCVELESAEARLACFGAEVDSVLDARAAAETDEPPAVSENFEAEDAEAQAQAEAEDDREPTRRDRRARRRAERRADDQASESQAAGDQYSGTITALRERLPESYVITLDNGQVWEQVEPKRYPLRPGLEVRIVPSRWGDSYRLSGTGTGGQIRVRRLR